MSFGSSLGKIAKVGARAVAAYYTGGASEAALAAKEQGDQQSKMASNQKDQDRANADAAQKAGQLQVGGGDQGGGAMGAAARVSSRMGNKKGMKQQLLSEGLRYMSNR